MKPEIKVIKSERKSISIDFPYGYHVYYEKPYAGKVTANINSKTTRVSLRFIRENETVVLTPNEAESLAEKIQAVLSQLTTEDRAKGDK